MDTISGTVDTDALILRALDHNSLGAMSCINTHFRDESDRIWRQRAIQALGADIVRCKPKHERYVTQYHWLVHSNAHFLSESGRIDAARYIMTKCRQIFDVTLENLFEHLSDAAILELLDDGTFDRDDPSTSLAASASDRLNVLQYLSFFQSTDDIKYAITNSPLVHDVARWGIKGYNMTPNEDYLDEPLRNDAPLLVFLLDHDIRPSGNMFQLALRGCRDGDIRHLDILKEYGLFGVSRRVMTCPRTSAMGEEALLDLIEHDPSLPVRAVVDTAIENGYVDVMQRLKDKDMLNDINVTMTIRSVHFMAQNRHVAMQDYAYRTWNIRPTTVDADTAAFDGQVEVLEWMASIGVYPTIIGERIAEIQPFLNG